MVRTVVKSCFNPGGVTGQNLQSLLPQALFTAGKYCLGTDPPKTSSAKTESSSSSARNPDVAHTGPGPLIASYVFLHFNLAFGLFPVGDFGIGHNPSTVPFQLFQHSKGSSPYR